MINAQNSGVTVPHELERKLRYYDDESREEDPYDLTVLEEAGKITDHVSRVVFPSFSLNREGDCEIHENVYWSLQTYPVLHENLAANEGDRSFTYESSRERTSLGHVHREQIRDLTIVGIREMYRQAVDRLLGEIAEAEEFFRAGMSPSISLKQTRSQATERSSRKRLSEPRRRRTGMRISRRRSGWSGMQCRLF